MVPAGGADLVQLGVSLEGIRTTGSLQTGVRLALTGDATKHRNKGR